MSFFDSLDLLPEDPIFSVPRLFAADSRFHKVNLGIGSYKDAEGASYVLDCVRDAEAALLSKKIKQRISSYRRRSIVFKIDRDIDFWKIAFRIFFWWYFFRANGWRNKCFISWSSVSLQNICDTIYLPNSSWPNHKLVFTKSGFKS